MAKLFIKHQFVYLALMWAIEIVNNEIYGGELRRYGLYSGIGGVYLVGVITSPFLHAGWGHLISNTIAYIPLSILCWKNFNFVFWFCAVTGGLITWLITPIGVVSVGASGVIYGLWGYLIARTVSVAFKGNANFWHFILMAITSYLVVKFFGGMWSGMVPSLVPQSVSWQGHLGGAIAGVVAAFVKPFNQNQEE